MTFQELLVRFNKFLIVSHEGLDGDAIGCSLAMGHFLFARGKEVYLFFPDPLPQKYLHLLKNLCVLPQIPKENSGLVLISLDSSDLKRLKIEDKSVFSLVVNIDHHATNSNFGDWNVVRSDFSSTGEILADLLLKEKLSAPEIVWDLLYLAIYADTNGFSFQNTSPRTLNTAAEVLSRASGPEIASLFFSLTQEELRILARALENMVFEPPIAYSFLENSLNLPEDFDSDYIMNFWKRWLEPKIYLLFKEVQPNVFKVSMRAHPGFDLTKIAVQFNGGGHPAAAGCTVYGNWPEAKDRLIEALRNEILKN
ncbi:MAG: DHH family phosphoesterase [bacterium]